MSLVINTTNLWINIAPAAEDAKPKETAYESEDEDDVSDSEVEGENFRINMKWDGRIHKVQYVRRDEDDNELYAIVRWTDSKVAKYKTSIVARKAPLKVSLRQRSTHNLLVKLTLCKH